MPDHLVKIIEALRPLDFTSIRELVFILRAEQPTIKGFEVRYHLNTLWDLGLVEKQTEDLGKVKQTLWKIVENNS